MSFIDKIVATKDLQQERLKICMSCDYITIVPLLGFTKCDVCGCPIRSKIAASSSECPKGKW